MKRDGVERTDYFSSTIRTFSLQATPVVCSVSSFFLFRSLLVFSGVFFFFFFFFLKSGGGTYKPQIRTKLVFHFFPPRRVERHPLF